MQVRAGVSQAPQRWRAPLTGRCGARAGASAIGGLGDPRSWWLTSKDGICVGIAELSAHVMQQQVAKDALNFAQFRQVATCAADRFEGCLAGLDLRDNLVVGRLGGDWNGEASDVVDQQIAFALVHIQACGEQAGEAWVSRLMPAGDFEPHFAGGGGKDEFLERRRSAPSIQSDRCAHP